MYVNVNINVNVLGKRLADAQKMLLQMQARTTRLTLEDTCTCRRAIWPFESLSRYDSSANPKLRDGTCASGCCKYTCLLEDPFGLCIR